MYVAVKGGERAIENAHRLLAHERRGDPDVPELSLSQIAEQLSLAVDRVMSEGSLYDGGVWSLESRQGGGGVCVGRQRWRGRGRVGVCLALSPRPPPRAPGPGWAAPQTYLIPARCRCGGG